MPILLYRHRRGTCDVLDITIAKLQIKLRFLFGLCYVRQPEPDCYLQLDTEDSSLNI